MMAHGVRTIAIEHPNIFPLVASRPPAAPWLRPPLRSLRWVEAFLVGLHHYGFSHELSVLTYRAFSTFLLGPPAARGRRRRAWSARCRWRRTSSSSSPTT